MRRDYRALWNCHYTGELLTGKQQITLCHWFSSWEDMEENSRWLGDPFKMFFAGMELCSKSKQTSHSNLYMHYFIQTHTHRQTHNVLRPSGRCECESLRHIPKPSHSLHKALIQMQSVYENKQWLKHPKGKIFKNPKNNYIIINMHSHSCKINYKEKKGCVSLPDSQSNYKISWWCTTYKRKVKVQLLRW